MSSRTVNPHSLFTEHSATATVDASPDDWALARRTPRSRSGPTPGLATNNPCYAASSAGRRHGQTVGHALDGRIPTTR